MGQEQHQIRLLTKHETRRYRELQTVRSHISIAAHSVNLGTLCHGIGTDSARQARLDAETSQVFSMSQLRDLKTLLATIFSIFPLLSDDERSEAEHYSDWMLTLGTIIGRLQRADLVILPDGRELHLRTPIHSTVTL